MSLVKVVYISLIFCCALYNLRISNNYNFLLEYKVTFIIKQYYQGDFRQNYFTYPLIYISLIILIPLTWIKTDLLEKNNQVMFISHVIFSTICFLSFQLNIDDDSKLMLKLETYIYTIVSKFCCIFLLFSYYTFIYHQNKCLKLISLSIVLSYDLLDYCLYEYEFKQSKIDQDDFTQYFQIIQLILSPTLYCVDKSKSQDYNFYQQYNFKNHIKKLKTICIAIIIISSIMIINTISLEQFYIMQDIYYDHHSKHKYDFWQKLVNSSYFLPALGKSLTPLAIFLFYSLTSKKITALLHTLVVIISAVILVLLIHSQRKNLDLLNILFVAKGVLFSYIFTTISIRQLKTFKLILFIILLLVALTLNWIQLEYFNDFSTFITILLLIILVIVFFLIIYSLIKCSEEPKVDPVNYESF